MTTLYIHNINIKITENNLRFYFSQFGEVKYCRIKICIHRRWGFIVYQNKFSADHALEKSIHLINDKLVYIKPGENSSYSKYQQEKTQNNTIRIQNHSHINQSRLYSYCQSYGQLLLFNYDKLNIILLFNLKENDKRFLDMRPHMINGTILRVSQCNSSVFPQTKSIFIKNIDQQINEYLLYEYFSKRYGRILNCSIKRKDNENSTAFLAFQYENDLIEMLNDNLTKHQQHRIKPHLHTLFIQQLLPNN